MFLPGSGTSSPVVWRVYVGGDLAGWNPPGDFSSQGGKKADRNTTEETYRQELVLPHSIIYSVDRDLLIDGD